MGSNSCLPPAPVGCKALLSGLGSVCQTALPQVHFTKAAISEACLGLLLLAPERAARCPIRRPQMSASQTGRSSATAALTTPRLHDMLFVLPTWQGQREKGRKPLLFSCLEAHRMEDVGKLCRKDDKNRKKNCASSRFLMPSRLCRCTRT